MNSLITRKKADRAVADDRRHPSPIRARPLPECPNAESVDRGRAVRADVMNQRDGWDCVGRELRPYYAPMVCRCRRCEARFAWSVEEQVFRYEVAKLHPLSHPPYCPDCSRAWRHRKRLLAEYDAQVGRARETGDFDAKARVVALITALCATGYTPPVRMLQTEAVLRAQFAKARRRGESVVPEACVTRNGRALHY